MAKAMIHLTFRLSDIKTLTVSYLRYLCWHGILALILGICLFQSPIDARPYLTYLIGSHNMNWERRIYELSVPTLSSPSYSSSPRQTIASGLIMGVELGTYLYRSRSFSASFDISGYSGELDGRTKEGRVFNSISYYSLTGKLRWYPDPKSPLSFYGLGVGVRHAILGHYAPSPISEIKFPKDVAFKAPFLQFQGGVPITDALAIGVDLSFLFYSLKIKTENTQLLVKDSFKNFYTLTIFSQYSF